MRQGHGGGWFSLAQKWGLAASRNKFGAIVVKTDPQQYGKPQLAS